MRKKTRRGVLQKLAASAALICALVGTTLGSMTAQADTIIPPNDTSKGTLTLTKTDSDGDPLAGAEFTLYKIMSLTPADEAGKYASYEVVDLYADKLKDVTPDDLGNYSAADIEAKVNELLPLTNKASVDTKVTSAKTGTDGKVTISGLDLGYYMVVETITPEGHVAGSPFFIAIPSTDNYNTDQDPQVGTEWIYEVEADVKNAEVPFEKNIEKEDNTLAGSDTVTVGDNVKYLVETTIPDYADEYFGTGGTVIFKITDTMSTGLKFNDDIEVIVGGTIIGEDTSSGTGNTSWRHSATATGYELVFGTSFIQAHRGEKVEIRYSAEVTDEAVIGIDGNTNKAILEYSNNPQNLCDTDKKEDDTIVFTFAIAVEKFAGEEYLANAVFALYSDAGCTQQVLSNLTTDDKGIITFERVAAGTYYLKEMQSPEGYKLLTNPIKVEIIATTGSDGEYDGGFQLYVDGVEVTATSGKLITRYDYDAGLSTIAVENQKGFTLPKTGGMGVIALLIAGLSGIAIISIVMLKKRQKG
ncbi:MAG: SpaH/EbpB family LPXTG-anchored major pilin [Lachnospiraceae bacterium]